ncbi:MAG: hypothetical protein AB1916_11815 [Thermodesulfobacteriota bacterium]
MDERKPQDAPGAPTADALLENVPEQLHPGLRWLLDNLRTVGLAVGAVLAVAAVVAVVQHVRASNLENAQVELGRILLSPDPAARAAALEKLEADAPAAVLPAVRIGLAESLTAAGEFAKAEAVLDKLTTDSPASLATPVAMAKAAALSRRGDHSAALATILAAKQGAPEAYALPLARQAASEALLAGDIPAQRAALAEVKSLDPERSSSFVDYLLHRLDQAPAAAAKGNS